MAPSQLQIATSSLQRLLKEEASYYKELEQQKARIAKLENQKPVPEDETGNREFQLKQERKALEETKAVIPSVRERITNAREKLESYLESWENEEEANKARELLKTAKEAQKNDAISTA